jgi:hypothetical protein
MVERGRYGNYYNEWDDGRRFIASTNIYVRDEIRNHDPVFELVTS